MNGFAARPGTDVDPACSSSRTREPSAARTRAASALELQRPVRVVVGEQDRAVDARRRADVDAPGARPLGLERPTRRRRGRVEPRRRRLQRRQVEVDVVVDQEVDDLLGVLCLLDRLLAEGCPSRRDSGARSRWRSRGTAVGGELVADLGDQSFRRSALSMAAPSGSAWAGRAAHRMIGFRPLSRRRGRIEV